jgi:hypothetical protein
MLPGDRVRRRATGLAAVALSGVLVAGCGGSGSEEPSGEVQQLGEEIKSLTAGEILIKGLRSPKFSGPYRFQPGGYVLRYSQEGGSPGLSVSLESQRGSKREPYQLVIDTDRAAGRTAVDARGRLYVHVVSSADSYELRFTPKRAGS